MTSFWLFWLELHGRTGTRNEKKEKKTRKMKRELKLCKWCFFSPLLLLLLIYQNLLNEFFVFVSIFSVVNQWERFHKSNSWLVFFLSNIYIIKIHALALTALCTDLESEELSYFFFLCVCLFRTRVLHSNRNECDDERKGKKKELQEFE